MRDEAAGRASARAAATRRQPVPIAAEPMRAWLARRAYTIGWYLALPAVVLYLLWRSRRQPAYRRHWGERFGRFGARPAGLTRACIWVHAVSVGETRAAQPLIEALLKAWPSHRLLLTHMTPTGRDTGATLYGDRVQQCYLPYDIPAFIDRFLARHEPAIGLIMETELWPNLVVRARRAGVPLLLVNARLSEKSLAKGLRTAWLMRPALQGLTQVLAQSPADAARIAVLGRADVPVLGNLKFDITPDAALQSLGRDWRARIARPVILLASSRDGEEALVLAAWSHAPTRDVALAVVPRHPQRFPEVGRMLAAQAKGQPTATLVDRQALGAGAGEGADLLLGDSMGEMTAWFSLADVVIMGGSLLAFGGQNLIEACACAKPVVVGPSTYNFEEAATHAIAAGAACRVASAEAAVQAALALLGDEPRRAAMARSASAFAQAHRGATERTLAAVSTVMAPALVTER